MISTGHAGYHYPAAVYPGLHSHPRYKKPITITTKLSSQFARDTYSFFHCYTAGKDNTPVTPYRVFRKEPGCLIKEDRDPLTGNMSSIRPLMLPGHQIPLPQSDISP